VDDDVLIFRRSSFCSVGACVEVAVAEDEDRTVVVRTSRRPLVEIRMSMDEWAAFVAGVKAGEFDPA
jgi:hypothetical protein